MAICVVSPADITGWCGVQGGWCKSTVIHVNKRKTGSREEKKKRCLMGCSRSVTCLTGTISLTHLVCHSQASVHRLLINRASECFMS